MTVSVTLTGTPEQIVRVLEFWQEVTAEGVGIPTMDDLVRSLTTEGQKTVRTICKVSADGRGLDQSDLHQLLGLSEENELYGILGGIGYRWARLGRGPNPFTRKWDSRRNVGFYQVDANLAREFLSALD
jgi:hypothetical protein